jgi:hypothetical protein
MTDNDAWLYQISFKTAGQTLINLRGGSKEDMSAALEMIQELATDIAATEAVVGVLQPVGAYRAPAAAAPKAAPVAVPPAGAPPAGPSVEPPICKHGLPAKFVAGGVSSKTKRPYRAFWACSQDREYQCDFRQDG